MITNSVLYGTYYFGLSTTFQADLIYLSTLGATTYFKSNGIEFFAIASEDVGGVVTLKYIERDNTEVVVWDENQEWLVDEYRYITFEQPTDIGNQYFERVEFKLTPYTSILTGHFVWNTFPNNYVEFYLANDNYYQSNGEVFYTLRYDNISGNLYYDDKLVYNSISLDWFLGEEYKRLDFYNVTMETPFYDCIVNNMTQVYEATFIAPILQGFQSFLGSVIKKQVLTSDLPLTINNNYAFNDKTYYCVGYFLDVDFTTPLVVPYSYSVDTNIYVQLIESTYISEARYVVNIDDIIYDTFTYLFNFVCKNMTTRFGGMRRITSSLLEYLDIDSGVWINAWSSGDWVNNNYSDIKINESFVPNDLLNKLVLAYNIEYTTNVEGVVIATQYWKTGALTSSELPTITPPTHFVFDGWYYDSLFINKASTGNTPQNDIHLYAKVYLPSSIDIYLYENVDVNNSVRKNPIQKALISGTFKLPTSVTKPIVQLGYTKLDFNYCYIPSFNRYYYVDDVVVINSELIEIYCSCDVLMSFKSQLMNTKAIVSRNEYDYNKYLIDVRDTLEEGNEITLVDATGGESISSDSSELPNGNIVLMGVK